MMVAAQENAVVEFGPTEVQPADHMMTFTPGWWPITGREGTSAIPQHEGAADGAGEQSSLPAEVEDLALPAQDRGQDSGVARQPAHDAGAQAHAGVEHAGSELPGERVEAAGDHQLDGFAT
jgi:hypothetical protein